jgi:hypothetical protein
MVVETEAEETVVAAEDAGKYWIKSFMIFKGKFCIKLALDGIK